MIMTSETATYNYTYQYDYLQNNEQDLSNKLLCTFYYPEQESELISDIQSKYTITQNRLYVLEVSDSDEYVVTYNVEIGNVGYVPKNTIMVHRKKETNTLYTINALNLITEGKKSVEIIWNTYKNCILCTNKGELKKLDTTLKQIISF